MNIILCIISDNDPYREVVNVSNELYQKKSKDPFLEQRNDRNGLDYQFNGRSTSYGLKSDYPVNV